MLRPWNSWEERMKSVIFKHRKIAFTWKHLSGKQNDQKCKCNGPTEWLGGCLNSSLLKRSWVVPEMQRTISKWCSESRWSLCVLLVRARSSAVLLKTFCGLHYSSRSFQHATAATFIKCGASHPQKSFIFLSLSQRDHPPPWLSCRQVLWSFPAWVCRLCLSEGWSIEPQMRWHKWPVEATNPFSSSIIQPGKRCTNPISSCGDVTKFKDTPHHSTLFI